jgi:release factor glutamine methyltransferase
MRLCSMSGDFRTAEDGLDAATSVPQPSAGDPTHLPTAYPLSPVACRLSPVAYRLLSTATAELRTAGVESPRLDAEVLLAHVLGVGRPYLLAHGEDVLPASARAAFEALIVRRARGEPVAYLTGYRGWYDLILRVTPAVLVPRPETEGLLERALAWARERGVTRLADIGTGAGALAIALARALPEATVYASDISAQALAVARENAVAADAPASIVFLQGDLLAPLPERVDLIVANLPYLGADEYAGLPRDVRCYEPRQALVGGPLGHELLARLLATAADHLQEGGAIMAELGPPQAPATAAAARAAFPMAKILLERDYAGLLRYLIVST